MSKARSPRLVCSMTVGTREFMGSFIRGGLLVVGLGFGVGLVLDLLDLEKFVDVENNTVLSSYSGVTNGDLESDPSNNTRAQRLQTATFLQIATQLRGLFAALLGQALDPL